MNKATRTFRLKTLIIIGASLLASVSAIAAKPSKPNIVFILVDDLGWADIACFGSQFYETPNIDALAKSGVKMTSAYAASPVCSPTRGSILTGKYPARTQTTDWFGGNRDFGNLAAGLRAHGFSEEETTKVMGENWLAFFVRSFGAAAKITVANA